MAPNKEGRFCKQCSKNVIDFTAWGDAQLYDFFSRPQGHVCGRFLSTQLGREIALPVQPHSRLYRIVVALSLTLVFTAGEGKTFARQPIVFESPANKLPGESCPPEADTVQLKGTIADSKNEPLVAASVSLMQGSVQKYGAVTDWDGKYQFANVAPGTYELFTSYIGYTPQLVTGIVIPSGQRAIVQKDVTMKQGEVMGGISVPPRYKRHTMGKPKAAPNVIVDRPVVK